MSSIYMNRKIWLICSNTNFVLSTRKKKEQSMFRRSEINLSLISNQWTVCCCWCCCCCWVNFYLFPQYYYHFEVKLYNFAQINVIHSIICGREIEIDDWKKFICDLIYVHVIVWNSIQQSTPRFDFWTKRRRRKIKLVRYVYDIEQHHANKVYKSFISVYIYTLYTQCSEALFRFSVLYFCFSFRRFLVCRKRKKTAYIKDIYIVIWANQKAIKSRTNCKMLIE